MRRLVRGHASGQEVAAGSPQAPVAAAVTPSPAVGERDRRSPERHIRYSKGAAGVAALLPALLLAALYVAAPFAGTTTHAIADHAPMTRSAAAVSVTPTAYAAALHGGRVHGGRVFTR